MTIANRNRRNFLGTMGALSTLGLASRLDLLNFVAEANAQSTADYKALVCVFMFGGNDGNNTLIPIDIAGYAQYAAARPVASGINLAQSALLPIQPVNVGTPFGLHPSLGGLQSLFDAGKMAILANVARITVTGLLYSASQDRLAKVVFHDVAGWLMMPLAVAILLLEMRVLRRLIIDQPARSVQTGLPGQPVGTAAS